MTLERNLASLARQDPGLAERLRAASGLAPALLRPSRSGPPTATLPDAAGQGVQLASGLDPLREAARLIEASWPPTSSPAAEPMVFVVVGLGLGYHVAHLLSRRGPEDYVVAAESNLALLRSALERFDWSGPLAEGRLRFVTEALPPTLHRTLTPLGGAILMGTRLIVHPASARLDPAFAADIRRAFVEFVAATRVNLGTAATNTAITVLNLLMNLPAYVGGDGIRALKDAFAGYPAVVVSAGPSLAKNVHLLRDIRDRAVIVSVATTLKLLLERGIVPHFVTCLDFHEVSKRFFEDLPLPPPGRHPQGSAGALTRLVFDPKGTWHVADAWTGPMSVLGNEFLDVCLRDLEPPLVRERLASGSTVAHLAFYLARHLGADPIIFVGQDLGFSDGLYYMPGTAVHDTWRPELNRFWTIEMKEWERIARRRSMLHTIPDIHGRPMYTDDQMLAYLKRFEVDFQETRSRVIDASEGGARKAGSVVMPLADALAQHATRSLPHLPPSPCQGEGWGEGGRALPSPYALPEREVGMTVADALRRRIAETEGIRAICLESKDCLERLREVLEQPAEARPIFRRLEVLKRKIDEAGDAYRLVRALGQLDQLRRYQADRRIAAAGDDGILRQRRQIERDLDYVTGLAGQCTLLIEMFHRAIARLNKKGVVQPGRKKEAGTLTVGSPPPFSGSPLSRSADSASSPREGSDPFFRAI